MASGRHRTWVIFCPLLALLSLSMLLEKVPKRSPPRVPSARTKGRLGGHPHFPGSGAERGVCGSGRWDAAGRPFRTTAWVSHPQTQPLRGALRPMPSRRHQESVSEGRLLRQLGAGTVVRDEVPRGQRHVMMGSRGPGGATCCREGLWLRVQCDLLTTPAGEPGSPAMEGSGREAQGRPGRRMWKHVFGRVLSRDAHMPRGCPPEDTTLRKALGNQPRRSAPPHPPGACSVAGTQRPQWTDGAV